jgi:arginyl-tRNA synthetase
MLRTEHAATLAALDEASAIAFCARFAERVLLERIKDDLARFDVRFDRFVSERELHERGVLARALATIPERLLYDEGDALMFRTTEFGDEKDRAVRRSTGVPTYFGGDMRYHETVARRFDQLINVWGRTITGTDAAQAALGALGGDPGALRVLLVQLVNLTRAGQPVRMGKRAGEFVTLREVLDEVGADAHALLPAAEGGQPAQFDSSWRRRKPTIRSSVQYARADRERVPAGGGGASTARPCRI